MHGTPASQESEVVHTVNQQSRDFRTLVLVNTMDSLMPSEPPTSPADLASAIDESFEYHDRLYERETVPEYEQQIKGLVEDLL